MLEEYKTHYSDMKYCDRLGEDILVEQIKSSEIIIAQCKYLNLERCELDGDNPIDCPLQQSKLIRIIKE